MLLQLAQVRTAHIAQVNPLLCLLFNLSLCVLVDLRRSLPTKQDATICTFGLASATENQPRQNVHTVALWATICIKISQRLGRSLLATDCTQSCVQPMTCSIPCTMSTSRLASGLHHLLIHHLLLEEMVHRGLSAAAHPIMLHCSASLRSTSSHLLQLSASGIKRRSSDSCCKRL